MLLRVIPHYAIKCNDDEVLLKALLKKGVNFDCASGNEIKKVINLSAKCMMIDEARKILVDRPPTQKSLYISSPKFIENLVNNFHAMHPRVIPHYAIKCNDDEVLLKALL